MFWFEDYVWGGIAMTSSIIVAGLAVVMIVLLLVVIVRSRREESDELPTPQITPKLAEFKSKLDELETVMAALAASAEQANAERARRTADGGLPDGDPPAYLSNEAPGETLVPRRLENRVRRRAALTRRLAERKWFDDLYGEFRLRIRAPSIGTTLQSWFPYAVNQAEPDLIVAHPSVRNVAIIHVDPVGHIIPHWVITTYAMHATGRVAEMRAKRRVPLHPHPEMADEVAQVWQAFDEIEAQKQAVEADASA
jgi:Na+-transporting methylmalonyl-CoA/oxaloacetate decarboxylase gamma subunit